MTLTQQFLIVSILPLSFLLMALYTWRQDVQRPSLGGRWGFTLVTMALWGSSALRYYGGVNFSVSLVHTWGVIGSYLLSLTAVGILITTLSYLSVPERVSRITVGISVLFFLIGLALDPAVWAYQIPDTVLAGYPIRQFDLWAGAWIASWLLPLAAAWILTMQVNNNLPSSIYRNQIHYWLLVLTLIFIGSALASIRQPGQPVWQEIGLLFLVLAALIGTISIVNPQLPELQLAVRQLLSRLSGSLIIFGLTWLALSIIVQGITNMGGDTNPNLILTLAAAAFAGLFTAIYRIVNELTRRLFVPAVARRKVVMAEYANAIGNLPEPAQLGQLFLRNVQSNLATDDAWFMTVETGPQGKLMLRPLTALTDTPLETASFSHDSPLVAHLRQNQMPLAQYDVDTLGRFSQMNQAERVALVGWQRVVYMPLHAGDSLVGLLGLGKKYSGESYNAQDFEWLQAMSGQIGPLLAQAQNMASLRRINDFVFTQNQVMGREKQLLAELATLQGRFIEMVSPDLRRPFTVIKQKLHSLEQSVGDNGQLPLVQELSQQIDAIKAPLDHLIAMSGRIQRRSAFDFQPVHLDELARNAIRNLRTMAEARRVRVDFNAIPGLPTVLGDGDQLREAIQHLLHNAIKFNRIGGAVTVNCGVHGGHICVQVTDSGVGLAEDRLATLWDEINQPQSRALGAGLGLPLTHFIAAAHGGRVEVESVYGTGSAFSLFVPISFEE